MPTEQLRFTKAALAALPPAPSGKRTYVRDTRVPDLYLSITPTGAKSFMVYKWGAGRPQRVTLGRFNPDRPGSMTIDQARRKAPRVVVKVQEGRYISAEKRAARQAPTVRDLAVEYIERWAKPRKRTWKEDERVLEKDVLPKWGRRKAGEISRHDVITLVDRIADRGAPIQANRTLACVRKMFNFAIERGLIEGSPCVQVKAPGEERRRDRVLTEDEIKAVWSALDEKAKDLAMDPRIRMMLRLELMTAQRPGEVRAMQWDEIANDVWTIPAEKSKNGLPHRVPLCGLAVEILERARVISDGCEHVFPSPSGDKPMPITSISQSVRKNLKALGTSTPWTPHDLRRTAASHMTGIGIPRLVVGRILNHAERGVTATYDRHSYDQEKRRALEKWDRCLRQIVIGKKRGKVVRFR